MLTSDTCAIIIAGGSGTRLWPLSRRSRPKQFLRLFGERSLLQHAYDRLLGLIEPTAIYVVTQQEMVAATKRDLPDLPSENIIAEPDMRNTANAIGLAALLLRRETNYQKMLVTTADHLIEPVDRFQSTVRTALNAIDSRPHSLATMGVRPSHPHVGYGYLHLGEALSDNTFRVREFKEKPDRVTAIRYLSDGQHLWNSGMFAWRIDTLVDEMRRCLPENMAGLGEIVACWGDDARSQLIADLYSKLRKISIDHGVMENAKNVITIELGCSWWDVGSWDAVAALQPKDASGNAVICANAIQLASINNLLVADENRLIATVGVEDLVIVSSDDATLVCHRDHLDRVREVLATCHAEFGAQFE